MTGNNINEADKLREMRAEAFLGLRMASEKTGISAMRISQIECGKGDPLSKPEKDRLEKVYLDAIEARREPYIVRVPVRGILSMTFDSWEKARKEVDRIQSDDQTLEQLVKAGYKFDSMVFSYEAICRPQGMYPTCRSCFWFCYERNNVGKCGNWEKMAVDGIQNLPHRFATDTCGGWRKRKPQ